MTADRIQPLIPSPAGFVALVIDTDQASRLILRELIEREGGQVIEAGNCAAAVVNIEEHEPDIILLSVMATDGSDICAQIQALTGGSKAPVLMLIDLDDEAAVELALDAGAADYVTKPIRPAVLRQRTNRLLQAHYVDAAILRAKKEWEAAVDAVSDIVILTDMDGRITRCNLATIQRLETTYLQLIGCDLEQALLKDSGQKLNLTFGQPCEMQFPSLPGWFEARAFPGHLEGRQHAVVYVLKDITGSKRTEEALRASEERFQRYFELGGIGMAITAPGKGFIEVNDRICQILGYEESELLQINWASITHPDDLASDLTNFNRLLAGEIKGYSMEKRFIHKAGTIVYTNISVNSVHKVDGSLDYLVALMQDISERKQLEENVLQSEQRFKGLVNNISEGIQLIDANGQTLYANPAALEMTGYITESIGFNAFEYLHPDDLSHGLELFIQILQQPNNTITTELRIHHQDGSWIWIEASGRNMLAEPGISALLVSFRDITPRKQLEEALRESEARFRLALDNSPLVVSNQDHELRYTWLYNTPPGFDSALVLGKTDAELLEDAGHLTEIKRRVLETGIAARAEVSATIGGQTYIHDLKVEPLRGASGSIIGVSCAEMDITERKQVEMKLLQLSQAVEQSPISIVITNTAGDIEYVNPRFTQLTGYTSEEAVGQNPRFLKSGQTPPETYTQLWAAIHSGREWRGEFINRKKNGEIFIERATISPVIDTNGTVTHFLALKEDITEQKRAQAALAKSEERLRVIVETIPLPLLISAVADGTVLFANALLGETFGAPLDTLIGRQTPDFYVNPGDRKLLLDTLTKDGRLRNYELAVKHTNNTPFWVLVSGQFVMYGGQQALLAAFYDVTERRHAEQALHTSEARYRTLFEDLPVALWEEDFSEVKNFIDGLRAEKGVTDFRAYFEEHPEAVAAGFARVRVRDVNKAVMKMLGAQRKEEVIGGLGSIIFPETNSAFREELISIAEGCTHFTAEVPNRTLNGDTLYVSITWSVWPGYEDTLSNVTVSVVDLTERKLAEAALLESEQRFRQLFAASPDAVVVIDPGHPVDWKILDCNDAACHMNGYTREEMIGQSIDLLNNAVGTVPERAAYLERLRREGVVHLEALHQRKDGTIFPVEISTTLFTGEGRDLILGIDRDVTARKQVEEALQLSEKRFQLVTHATNDAVWDLDLSTGKQWWNRGARSLFGYTADQVGPDQTWWENQIHPDDRVKVLESFRAALSGDGQFWSKEYRFRRADGSYAYVFDRGYITQDEQGQPRRVIGAMMDLSERKRVEEALIKSEELFSTAFHDSPAPMAITRINDGAFIDVNGSWARLFGYNRQAVIGHGTIELSIYANPEDRSVMLQEVREQGKIRDYEIKARAESGEELALLMSAQMVEIQGQNCLLSTFYDITELRRMHDAMLASQKLADLGTLAAGVAHEMNSPLQVITGLSQSLLKKAGNGSTEPEQLMRHLDVIQRNGWRCAEIVRSLHTYARNSGGSMEPTSLDDLVCDGLLLIEHQLKSWANVSVRASLASDLPPLTCDHNQIIQVLINLLTNARDAMPDGGEITIATDYDPRSDQLILRVSDTGMGIPDSIRAKIFDPFFTTKSLGKGTGLGLSIVTGIVRAHGGTIQVDSALRQGTTFTMQFPAKPLKLPLTTTDDIPGRFDNKGGIHPPAAEQINIVKEPTHDKNSSR